MTRCLLRAQQVDWAFPPGHGIDAETGLKRGQPTSIASTPWPACSWPADPTANCSTNSTAARSTCPRSTWSYLVEQARRVAIP